MAQKYKCMHASVYIYVDTFINPEIVVIRLYIQLSIIKLLAGKQKVIGNVTILVLFEI